MKALRTAAVIGAGIAGCATAKLLADYGYQVTVFEQNETIASGGSGNPVAMLYPRLSGHNLPSHFALAAFEYSLEFYQSLGLTNEALNQCGLLQLGFDDKTEARIKKVANLFSDHTNLMDKEQASQLIGLECETAGLAIKQAAWIKPQAVCQKLLDHNNITLKCNSKISSLTDLQAFEHIILCNAHQASQFEETQHLALNAVRGQVSFLPPSEESHKLKTILCSDGYLSPVIDGQHHLGATFEANEKTLQVSDVAHQQNLNKLDDMPAVLATLKQKPWRGRVGLRCVTNDRLPMVGGVLNTKRLHSPLPRAGLKENKLPWLTHVWVNVAHGSHGFINAPYSSYLLTQLITTKADQKALDKLANLNPNRFYLRALGLKQLARSVATAKLEKLHFAPSADLS